MTRSQRLDALFEEWERRIPEPGRLCRDGIVCEECFETADPKLLFVSKEPNNPVGDGFDFRTWWTEEPVKYSFSHRLSEWAFGMQHGFPPLSEFDADQANKREAIRAIAFMNLKKVGGSASADSKVIKATVDREQDLLRRQIAIIEPDVIVGGIGNSGLWHLLLPDIEFIGCGFDIGVTRVDGIRVIDFYHPSYRVPRAMSYALLGRVFQSEIFARL